MYEDSWVSSRIIYIVIYGHICDIFYYNVPKLGMVVHLASPNDDLKVCLGSCSNMCTWEIEEARQTPTYMNGERTC